MQLYTVGLKWLLPDAFAMFDSVEATDSWVLFSLRRKQSHFYIALLFSVLCCGAALQLMYNISRGVCCTDVFAAGGDSSSGRTLKNSVRCLQREMWGGRLMRDWQYSTNVLCLVSVDFSLSNHFGAEDINTHNLNKMSRYLSGKSFKS